jgi:hypothetical protein
MTFKAEKVFLHAFVLLFLSQLKLSQLESNANSGKKNLSQQICVIECSVAQMVVRWLAVRQARVPISARHPMEVLPTELTTRVVNGHRNYDPS